MSKIKKNVKWGHSFNLIVIEINKQTNNFFSVATKIKENALYFILKISNGKLMPLITSVRTFFYFFIIFISNTNRNVTREIIDSIKWIPINKLDEKKEVE